MVILMTIIISVKGIGDSGNEELRIVNSGIGGLRIANNTTGRRATSKGF
jgi:hypothetical protein